MNMLQHDELGHPISITVKGPEQEFIATIKHGGNIWEGRGFNEYQAISNLAENLATMLSNSHHHIDELLGNT